MLTVDLGFWLFSISFVLMVSIMVIRCIAVARLRSRDRDAWARLSSPQLLERDHFFQKFPFRGLGAVYSAECRAHRLVLIAFVVNAVIFLLALSGAFACLVMHE